MADSSPNSLEPQDSDATRLAEEVKDFISKAQKLYARLQDLSNTERTTSPIPTSMIVLDIPSSANAPIRRCPNEVLFMIFGHALNPCHVRIRSLLLVCKHWYRIVIDNPQFWTQIRYTIPEDSMKSHWHRGAASYVSACMLRSCGLPLHLELDLQNLRSKGDYISQHMVNSTKEILDDFNFSLLENAVANRIYTELFLHELDIDCKAYNDSVSRACEIFFGEGCCNGERWTSLSLILPPDEPTGVLVWGKLTSAANLKRLVMYNVPAYYTDDEELIDAGPKELPLLEFISCTSSDALPLEMFRTLPTSVKHFKLWFRESLHRLQALSYHANLYSLELTGVDGYHRDTPVVNFRIQLPKLQVLKLKGRYGQLRSFELEFPALRTLIIQSDTAELAPLPKLSPHLIRWIINTDDSTPDERIIYTSVTRLALFSVTTTSIFLPSFGMQSSLACLGQLKKGGKLATRPALAHIYGRDPNGSLRKVDIEALGEAVTRRQSIDETAKVESSASSQSASTQQTTLRQKFDRSDHSRHFSDWKISRKSDVAVQVGKYWENTAEPHFDIAPPEKKVGIVCQESRISKLAFPTPNPVGKVSSHQIFAAVPLDSSFSGSSPFNYSDIARFFKCFCRSCNIMKADEKFVYLTRNQHKITTDLIQSTI